MYLYLKKNKDKEKGWLRQILSFKEDGNKQLNEKETVLLTIMTALFSGFNCNGGAYHGWNSMLCNAWNIN
jgi:hypothetical protein